MSAYVIEYPERIINNNSACVSKYNALHFPIVYKLQRQDYVIAGVSADIVTINFTTVHKVKITLTAPVSSSDSISVGDQIYFRSGLYDGTFNVTQILNSTQFYIDSVYKGSLSGGFINLVSSRKNYYVQTDVLGVQSNQYYVLGTLMNRSDNRGIIKIDVQPFVKGLEGYDNTFGYTVDNQADYNSSRLFNIRFADAWETNPIPNMTAAPINASTMMFFINAAKQIQDVYGQNMGEYVPFKGGNPVAKFLNASTPTYFPGFPFDLSFIYSDDISAYQIRRNTDFYNASGTLYAFDVTNLDAAQRFFMNRLIAPAIPAGAKYMNIYLQRDINASVTIGTYVNPNYVNANYQQYISNGNLNPNSPNG